MSWWLKLRKRRSLDRDLEAEIAFHRQMRAADAGAPPFGNRTQIQEAMRDMWSLGQIEIFIQDIRYAVRGLRRNQGFALVAILLIALGIGANTAIFSIVNGVLLNPLPYKNSDRLVWMHAYNRIAGGGGYSVSAHDFFDWRARQRSFYDLACYTGQNLAIAGSGEPELVSGQAVSANFFDVFGVQPMLGRTFREEENERGRDGVIVLSYGLWRRKFGGDYSIPGRAVTINGEPYTVIGVMPPKFSFRDRTTQAWVPLALKGGDPERINRRAKFLRVIGALKPESTIDSARMDMESLATQIEREHPDTNAQSGVRLTFLKELFVRDVRTSLLVLMSAVGCVLLIACANLGGLLLARSSARQKEMALRTALGAGRGRLVRQMLTESLVLAVVGGVAGVALATIALDLLIALAPADLPRIDEVRLDTAVVAFAASLTLVTAFLFGLWPAIAAARQPGLSSRGAAATGVRQRARSALVVVEVALAMVLLVVASLMVRSFQRLTTADAGFEPEHAITASFVLTQQSYPTSEKMLTFTRRLLEHLGSTPGLTTVGLTTSAPLLGNTWRNPVSIEGHPPAPGTLHIAGIHAISPHYLRALGTPLRLGRELNERDSEQVEPVVVIGETMARHFWPNESPIGRKLKLGGGNSPEALREPWRAIVGVVADIAHRSIDAERDFEVYFPYAQLSDSLPMTGRGLWLIARTSAEPAAAMSLVKSAIKEEDSQLAVRDLRPMRDVVSDSLAQPRFRTGLMALFASIALILAAVGLYGVIAYGVTQRTQEIGVRVALGARSADITKLIVGQGAALALIGAAAGTVAALASAQLIERLLFGVSPHDLSTFVAVPTLLVVVALIAAYIPARRAAQLDPMEALRTE